MDKVLIERLEVITTVGVYAWEQQIRQKLWLDIHMAWDTSTAARTDDVRHCLDYAKACEAIISHLQNGCFALLERVAEEVAQLLLTEFNTSQVRVKVSKPGAVPQAASVGVVIERQRASLP